MFFEKGFKKLSIREVRLRLGDFKGKNSNRIICAGTCDYSPYLKEYGKYFSALARVNMNNKYIECQEYKERLEVYEKP